MAKPICVVYFPDNYYPNDPAKVMQILNGFADNSMMAPTDYWKDYLWFCFTKPEISVPEFEVFHEKDFTVIQYEELKTMLENSLNQLKTNQ